MQNHLVPRAWIRSNHSNYLGLHFFLSFFFFFSSHVEEDSEKRRSEMVDERRMREARVKKGGAKEKDSWRGRVRGWRQRGRSTVSRVSVITVSVFSGVNSCIWPWHLPDPHYQGCFSTLLAAALAGDAIFQFGNNACQAASFCPRFFPLFPLCAQPAVSQDKYVPDTMFGSVKSFSTCYLHPFFLLFFFPSNIYSLAGVKEGVGKNVNPSDTRCFFVFECVTW